MAYISTVRYMQELKLGICTQESKCEIGRKR